MNRMNRKSKDDIRIKSPDLINLKELQDDAAATEVQSPLLFLHNQVTMKNINPYESSFKKQEN